MQLTFLMSHVPEIYQQPHQTWNQNYSFQIVEAVYLHKPLESSFLNLPMKSFVYFALSKSQTNLDRLVSLSL